MVQHKLRCKLSTQVVQTIGQECQPRPIVIDDVIPQPYNIITCPGCKDAFCRPAISQTSVDEDDSNNRVFYTGASLYAILWLAVVVAALFLAKDCFSYCQAPAMDS